MFRAIANCRKYRSALLQKDRGIIAVPGRSGARRFVVVTAPPPASPWSPLRRPLFRSLWIADVASNIGTWMHDAAAAWLMTLLAPSPLLVSLVQAATTLPLFLLALPAGALADIFDRRRILLIAQVWWFLTTALQDPAPVENVCEGTGGERPHLRKTPTHTP